ncbi:Putative ribonuclease H protein At1g65750 [Linum grandiflorum]
MFGCTVGLFPATYLGLPLGVNAKSSAIWKPVLDTMQSRLQSWKARFLSFGGRRQVFPGTEEFPYQCIWKKEVPTKIQGFLWMVYYNRILTMDNLQRRGLTTPNWCSLCRGAEESVSHIFLLCSYSRKVWDMFSSTLSIFGPLHHSLKGVIVGWKVMNCSTDFADAIGVFLHAFCWQVWLERNSRIFRDVERSESQLAYRISYVIGAWLKAADVFTTHKLLRWSNFCYFDREPD